MSINSTESHRNWKMSTLINQKITLKKCMSEAGTFNGKLKVRCFKAQSIILYKLQHPRQVGRDNFQVNLYENWVAKL